ncbi:FAD-binding domain-containing protein 28 [Elsinoe fawcettii]|nr:FAD-binding domain-containing protein 28 [Elsinoe fawcettii]
MRPSLLLSLTAFLLSPASAEPQLLPRQEDLEAQLATVQNGARITPARASCEVLRRIYPQFTSFNGSAAYIEDNTNFWTAASALGPACIFAPDRPEAMSAAVLLLRLSRSPFAVRGGGHMPLSDFNNIDGRGVLLSTTAFKKLALSPGKTSINVGPGNRWRDVYGALEPHGLAVVGGRVGPVGVPGFILGGGVSYFGQQRGWAVNNVASIEVVLADGRVVTASSRGRYSDLFWALKGGGNSFGIITNVELQAFPAPALTIGDQVYGGDEVKNKWFDAIVNQAIYGNQDDKHAVTPIANRRPLSTGDTIAYSSALFYSEDNNRPKVLENWTAPNLVPIAGSQNFTKKTLAFYVGETGASFDQVRGLRQRFYFQNIPANRRALEIAHNVFFDVAKQRLAGAQVFSIAFAAMPMITSFFENAIKRGGDPMSVKPEPQIWIEFSHTYRNAADEPLFDSYLRELDGALVKALTDAGFPPNKFIYLNDAERFQDVFGGYPVANLQRLKQIRNKYDPSRLLTDQLVGGWKVDRR